MLQMKTDYNKVLKSIIESLDHKPRLLLHSCCGPCSTYCISRLNNHFDITVLYYNPNIEPIEEYEHRKSEQIKFLEKINIKLLDIPYSHEKFVELSRGLENEPEGKKRCTKCINHRLEVTRNKALENNFEYFGTTLTVSPHKNSELINNLGKALETENIKYLFSDFKKENGYLQSVGLAKKYDLYRQNYCGCLYVNHNETKG